MKKFSADENRRFLATRSQRGASANVILENQQGELLVVKATYKDYWSLPGGWIDGDESPLDAARREVHEELGITLEPSDLDLSFVVNRVGPDVQTYLFVFIIVHNTTYDIHDLHLQSREIEAVRYVSKDGINANPHDYNDAVRNWAAEKRCFYLETMIH